MVTTSHRSAPPLEDEERMLVGQSMTPPRTQRKDAEAGGEKEDGGCLGVLEGDPCHPGITTPQELSLRGELVPSAYSLVQLRVDACGTRAACAVVRLQRLVMRCCWHADSGHGRIRPHDEPVSREDTEGLLQAKSNNPFLPWLHRFGAAAESQPGHHLRRPSMKSDPGLCAQRTRSCRKQSQQCIKPARRLEHPTLTQDVSS